jgi:pantoate--beta-alanine ligase
VQVVESIEGFRKALDAERAAGRSVGLVPTMGYLHDGHVSLMHHAAAECDVVAATVFVNPLQFGPGEDLDRYPRDPDGDRDQAARAGVDHLFVPSIEEMYAEPVLTRVSVAKLGEGMEGAHRPGHFEGVATVVAKLFAISGLCRAYFGEKDYQQLLVIRRMVSDLSFPVEVIACPTVRHPDGLALSSRNAYLSVPERRAATVLYRALLAGKEAVESGQDDAGAVSALMARVVRAEPLAHLEYAEAHPEVHPGEPEWRLFVAARLGETRLIDNMAAAPPGR